MGMWVRLRVNGRCKGDGGLGKRLGVGGGN